MKEEKTMLLKLYVSNLRKSAELIDKIIPVVKTFDGTKYKTRINAEAIVQNMTENKADLIKKAEDLEDSLIVKPGFNECKIEAWINAVEDLHKKASELNDAIPSAIKDIFEIKSWASWR